jgi:hypothetical protein
MNVRLGGLSAAAHLAVPASLVRGVRLIKDLKTALTELEQVEDDARQSWAIPPPPDARAPVLARLLRETTAKQGAASPSSRCYCRVVIVA